MKRLLGFYARESLAETHVAYTSSRRLPHLRRSTTTPPDLTAVPSASDVSQRLPLPVVKYFSLRRMRRLSNHGPCRRTRGKRQIPSKIPCPLKDCPSFSSSPGTHAGSWHCSRSRPGQQRTRRFQRISAPI